MDVDYKRQGGVTTVPLCSAEEVALLEVVRPSVDWRAVRTVAAGRRSPLAALDPIAPGRDRAFLAEVAPIARVGRAAVVNWRRRHSDFPPPVAGTDVHPQFDRRQVAAWLLTHDKIGVPTGPTVASVLLAGTGGATHRFRLDDPLRPYLDGSCVGRCQPRWRSAQSCVCHRPRPWIPAPWVGRGGATPVWPAGLSGVSAAPAWASRAVRASRTPPDPRGTTRGGWAQVGSPTQQRGGRRVRCGGPAAVVLPEVESPCSWWGSRDVLDITVVCPDLVAEVSADRAIDHGGVFRHPLRFKRLRLDVTVVDVPRFGQGPVAAAG
ncbi:hypothetical protein BGK67_00460 [Streptomyces subrutilus]|uniref:Uncharacterized protein n=1 Tax=Streptomyces subrutilus TaxID=36818 RepID=A0A1E5PKI6_9ACTN|nr:hypothetical protein BGK67_00460 [Streptomyces subrutilus]